MKTPSSEHTSRSEYKEAPTTREYQSLHQGATDRPSVGEWKPGSASLGFTVRDKYLNHWQEVLRREGIGTGQDLVAVPDEHKNIFYRIEVRDGDAQQLERIISNNLPPAP